MLDILAHTGSELAPSATPHAAPDDPLCYRSRNGKIIRLPNYNAGLEPIDLLRQGDYQLRARTISPTRSQPQAKSQARFHPDACLRGKIVYSQRHDTEATSLTTAVVSAKG